jgi:dTDP-4-dehydrorhamnose 3,5-epimerase
MLFTETPLPGVWIIDIEPSRDERGYFARTFCREEFTRRGLNPHIEQCNVSYNTQKGTLRGMHWQQSPHEEAKLVRCIGGAIWDVAVDIRENSNTYRQWFGIELSADNGKALYIPEGFAHGFITLEDHAMVVYQVSAAYYPESAAGLSWDDPAVGIVWPMTPKIINEKDRSWSKYRA